MNDILFGIRPASDRRCWWGARAIYTGRSIDLLRDRQQMIGEPDAREALGSWLNLKALPLLRSLASERSLPATHEDSLVVISGDGFCLHASPRASYGYLYIGAWDDPTAEHGLSVRVRT